MHLAFSSFTAMAVIGLWSVSSSAAGNPDPIGEIHGLVARGHSESRACGKFRKKWKNVVRGGLMGDSASHTSKEHALEVLGLLEKYPLRTPSYAQAWTTFVEKEAELEKLPDQDAVLAELGKIEPVCELFSRETHLSLLFKDIRALGLKAKDGQRIHRLARNYFADEESSRTLAGLGTKATVLQRYLENAYQGDNRAELLTRAKAFLDDFETQRMQAEEEGKKAGASSHTLASFAPQFRAWNALSRNLSELSKELGSEKGE